MAAALALSGAWSGNGNGIESNTGTDPFLLEAIRSWYRTDSRVGVEVWTNRDELFQPGESARVYFRSDENAYVTVFRVDTDGRVEVLFPTEPWENNYARGGRRYQIDRYRGRHAFIADEYPGQGYLFAVASRDPYNYAAIVTGERWDYRYIADDGRIVGDPYAALTELIDVIVPAAYEVINYDIVPYYVERRYEYPRFLCYDCHAYAPYPYWDPYRHSCVRVRIIIYDDPYYYPVRVYGGPRVVYAKPRRLEPRFVIRDRVADQPFVVRERRRAADPEQPRRVERDVTTADRSDSVRRVPAPSTSPPDRRAPSGARAGVQRDGEPADARRVEPQQRRPQTDSSAAAARPSPTRRKVPGASLDGSELRATPRRVTPTERRPPHRVERDTGASQSRPTLRRREPQVEPRPETKPRAQPPAKPRAQPPATRSAPTRRPQTALRRRKP
jgi:hypothetical protein